MPSLFIYPPGSFSYQKAEFTKLVYTLGRQPENDLMLPDKHISSKHCQIKLTEDGRYEIEDLNSSNGTYLNGYLINKKTPLKDGDVLKIGLYRFFFKLNAEEKTTQEFLKIRSSKDLIEEKLDDLDQTIFKLKKNTKDKPAKMGNTLDHLQSSLKDAQKAYTRLKALYRSANMIISHLELEQRLQVILKIAIELMEGDRGYIMLYDNEPDQCKLNIRVNHNMDTTCDSGLPSMTIANKVVETGVPQKIDNTYDVSELMQKKSILMQHIVSAICAPLKFEDRIIGVLYVDNVSSSYHYTDEDVTIFEILVNQAAVAIENARLFEKIKEEERKRANLEHYFSPQVVQEVLSNEGMLELYGAKKIISTIFVDIRGFTQIAETHEAKQLVDSLNAYFERMGTTIFKYNGCIDKFYGDGLMALFGAPIEDPSHFYNACMAACEMMIQVQEYRKTAVQNGLIPFHVGIGVNSGYATIGNIGSSQHMEYTAIGDTVNLAFRLSSLAGEGQVIISQDTIELLKNTDFPLQFIKSLGDVDVKGKEKPVKVSVIEESICSLITK